MNPPTEDADRREQKDPSPPGNPFGFERWVALERALYPIEFTSGIHELDEIQFVRVSPADAQIGLSQREARKKVAGDELAHFSSFLRRDWRSNDLLYGRLDGICQVLRSLLDDDALLRAARREQSPHADKLFDEGRFEEHLPRCPDGVRQELIDAWGSLVKETATLDQLLASPSPTADAGWRSAADRFRGALILAGQEDAFREDFEGVLADHYFQEIAYGRLTGAGGTSSESSEATIEGDAQDLARRDLGNGIDGWQRFLGMELGSQPITGQRAGLPNNVVGEYVTASYLLLWGILKRSLGDHGSLLDLGRARLLFRTPVVFFHQLFSSMRRDRRTALALSFVGIGVLFGLGSAAFVLGEWWLLAFAVAVALVGFAVFNREAPRWPRYVALIVIALFGTAVWFGKDANDCLDAAPDGDDPCAAVACSDCDPPMLVLEFVREARELIDVVGEPGDPRRAAAKRLLGVDFAFIAAYSLLFVSVSLLLLRSSDTVL
jgi:hypothetical protein